MDPILIQNRFYLKGSLVKACADDIRRLALFVKSVQYFFHSVRSQASAPAHQAGIIKRKPSGRTFQRSVVKIRLQDLHDPVVDEQRLRVIQRTHKKFYCSGFPVFPHLIQFLTLCDLFSDLTPYQAAAIRRIVIHRIGIHDQILIGEYRNIGFPDVFQHIRKSIGIHRRNDKRSHLFFQHVPDLKHLPGYISLRVTDHRLVTILFQTALEGLRIAGPFFFVRKKHCHFLYILRFLIAVLLLCLFRI